MRGQRKWCFDNAASLVSCTLAQMKVVVFSRGISVERFAEVGGNAAKTVVCTGNVFVENGSF